MLLRYFCLHLLFERGLRMAKQQPALSIARFGALLLLTLGVLYARRGSALSDNAFDAEWPYYGHDAGGTRYSPLTQVNRENVSKLKVAWTFHTGDLSDGRGDRKRSGFET